MGKYQYVISEEMLWGGFTVVASMLECSIQRRSVVTLGKPDLEGRKGSAAVGMGCSIRRTYLCNVLVDDVGEHGIHGSKVVQCASSIVKLSLVMFPKSNLHCSQISG